MTSELHDSTVPKATFLHRVRRVLGKLIRWSLYILGLYLLVVLLGLIPANRNFVPSEDSDSVSVFVFSGPVH
ncbi:MAG: hypothetical protein AAF497_07290, partial [Planctomycetota bacterium]